MVPEGLESKEVGETPAISRTWEQEKETKIHISKYEVQEVRQNIKLSAPTPTTYLLLQSRTS